MLAEHEVDIIKDLVAEWKPKNPLTVFYDQHGRESSWDSYDPQMINRMYMPGLRLHPGIILAKSRGILTGAGIVTAINDVKEYILSLQTPEPKRKGKKNDPTT